MSWRHWNRIGRWMGSRLGPGPTRTGTDLSLPTQEACERALSGGRAPPVRISPDPRASLSGGDAHARPPARLLDSHARTYPVGRKQTTNTWTPGRARRCAGLLAGWKLLLSGGQPLRALLLCMDRHRRLSACSLVYVCARLYFSLRRESATSLRDFETAARESPDVSSSSPQATALSPGSAVTPPVDFAPRRAASAEYHP